MIDQDQRDAPIGISDVIAFIRKNIFILICCVGLGSTAGGLFSVFSTPIYVARSKLLLQKGKPMSGGDLNLFQFNLDTAQIESQIQVIQSDEIVREVVDELGLINDHEIMNAGASLLRRLQGRLQGGLKPQFSLPEKDVATSYALDVVIDRLSVRRIGQSYAIELSFWSENPQKAARIINSIVASYIKNQLAAKTAIAESGTELLAKQITLLKSQLEIAQLGVQKGVIDVRSFPSSDARVISAASPPLGRSWPKTSLMIAIGGLLGFLPGVLISAMRHGHSEGSVPSRKKRGLRCP